MFNNRQELKDWISNYIKTKSKKSLHIAINNSKDIKSDLVNFTKFLPENTKLNQRCFHILNDLDIIPLCKECNLKLVNFNNRDKEWKYLEFCSTKCSSKNKDVIKKYKETNKKKYGFDNISKTEYFRESMIKHNQETYGVDWYITSDDFREKSKISCLKKYGFDNYTKTEEFKSKMSTIFLKKYGVDWYAKSQEFKDKFKEKSLEIYGVEHPMLNEKVKSKVSKTIFERYGEKWYILTKEFKEYCFVSNFNKYGNPIFSYKLKEYKLPSGKVVKVQGYENFALDILLKKYNEDEISITYADIKEEIGTINYLLESQSKIYLPDIYIKTDNKIIEVKSKYTYLIEESKNIVKKETCISMGIDFEFWIIDKKGKLIDIK